MATKLPLPHARVKLVDSNGLASIDHLNFLRSVREAIQQSVPVGSLIAYCGPSVPDGWLLADGSEVSRTTYADLWQSIGTYYGSGDGSTTFTLPDGSDRYALGVGTQTLGQHVGDNSQYVTHTHPLTTIAVAAGAGASVADDGNTGISNATVLDNRPASIVINWLVKF